jgi:hypothetical protein
MTAVAGTHPRIGYAPFSSNLTHPGDRRRFLAYARARGLPFEIARPDQRYDVVVLSELADISVWPKYRHGKIIYDSIDSYLAIPRTDVKQMLRGVAWFASGRHRRLQLNFPGAIERMCARADAVICTTEAQKHDITSFCPNVHVILDIHDHAVRNTKSDYCAGVPFNLVWEGLPSNLPHLETIRPVLRELSQRRPVGLNIVTDPDRPRLFGRFGRIETLEVARRIFDNVAVHRWDETTFSDIVTRSDAAIIPIALNDVFAAGKPGNKLALLWRLAMPVVTSATPAYLSMQKAIGLGHFACTDAAGWFAALDRLMTNEAERREAGERGHSFVTSNLGTNKLLELWDDAFASVGFDFRGGAPHSERMTTAAT